MAEVLPNTCTVTTNTKYTKVINHIFICYTQMKRKEVFNLAANNTNIHFPFIKSGSDDNNDFIHVEKHFASNQGHVSSL